MELIQIILMVLIRHKSRSAKISSSVPTVAWHETFAGSNSCDFCGFFHDLQKYVPAKKVPAIIFSAGEIIHANITSRILVPFI